MSNRASYQHVDSIKIGQNKHFEPVRIGRIGVFCAATNRHIVSISFDEQAVKEIARQNPSLNVLNIAVRLATASRIMGFYASSTCGISRKAVFFRGIK